MVPDKPFGDCIKKGKNVPLYTANTEWLKCGAVEGSERDLYWHAQKQIWQNWQRKSKSVNTERALVHRRWPKSPAFPLFPFKYLLLRPLGEQWCKHRRTFRHFQLVMVPSSEDKALNEKSTAQTNPRNPAFSSCSAVLATALNYSLIVSFS